MQIFPAIDLKDGACVRLLKGDFDAQTVYSNDPVEMARSFLEKGAEWVHVVDLDGAKDGEGRNLVLIGEIVKLGIRVQTGGGIRSMADVDKRMEMGVSLCVIGTAAVEDPQFVADAVQTYPGRIVAGIDEREGRVAVRGWLEQSSISALDLAKSMKALGVETVVHTDIQRDGMKTGAGIEKSRILQEKSGQKVVVSGGVSGIGDVQCAKEAGLYGVILGKALYDGEINLKEALLLAE